jgi:glycosyltransferase involved in cell wall biosynthesis
MASEACEQKLDTAAARDVLSGKRLLVVLPSLELGGAERQAIGLARFLKEQCDAEVAVCGLGWPDGAAADLCRKFAIACHYHEVTLQPGRIVGALAWAREIPRFARHLRRHRPHVLLPFYGLANMMCGLTWRQAGAASCIWNQRDEGRPAHHRLERWAAGRTPCFVTNSTAGADYLRTAYGLKTEQIHTVPNGVRLDPPQADRATWRQRLRLAEDQFAACMVANLHGSKDHVTLIRAWRIVVERRANDELPPLLLLAGRWDHCAGALRALANRLGLFDEVRFLGAIDDVSGLLGAMDLSVFSSQREGCPNGVLESMAAGLAVVATDIPGTRDALGPDPGPCLAPAGEPEALAEAILQVMANDSLREQLGGANRKRAEMEFAPERMGRRMEEIIAGALAAE